MEKVWNSVLERCKDKHAYLTWEYVSTAWKHFFSNGKKLKTLVIEDNGKIIAIAPLRQSRYSFLGPISYDVIEPLAYRGADYTGLILAEREAECLKAFLNYLVEHDDWDFIYLYDIPGASIIPELLSKESNNDLLSFDLNNGAICPYMPLPNSIDILMKGLSKKLRKNLRNYTRRLKKDYQRVEFKEYKDFGSVENAMAIFFNLHQKRWASKHMSGVFSTQEIRDFYIDIAKQFAENGWLALYFLTVNDKPIAASYNYVYGQKMYFVLGGFDPEYSQYSVGHLIHQRVIEDCILNQIKEYDLLKGPEPYKLAWTKKYRQNLGIRFVNKKFTSNFYDWGIKTLKQLKMEKILEKFLNF